MNDELDDLKRDYRSINAPPFLATRIKGSVLNARSRSGFWMPAAVTCTAVIALVWALPFGSNVSPDVIEKPAKPSMSALAALKPSKPSVPAPSLSQLRSVSVPRMPTKPGPSKPVQPQTNYQFEIKILKEKDNAYI